MTILKMLDLSTAHVSKETAQMLDDDRLSDFVVPYQKGDFGWFIWVPPVEHEGVPADLRAVLAYARTQQCDWVMLDCDAETIDNLPSFDW